MSSHEKPLIVSDLSDEKEKLTDSKRSWFVCFCGWLTQVVILGVLHGFGVFFVQFVDEFNATNSKAGMLCYLGNIVQKHGYKIVFRDNKLIIFFTFVRLICYVTNQMFVPIGIPKHKHGRTKRWR